MPEIEVSLPEELYTEFEHMIEEEFVNRDEAVEELLTAGIDAYTREFDEPEESNIAEEYASDIFDTAEGPRGEDEEEFGFR
ncbi:MAG: CopG family ribbon-helix-helix protein [Halobacteriales archaeon]